MGGVQEYGYTPGGRIASYTNRRGVTASYSYDAVGRLTAASYSNGEPGLSVGYDDQARTVTLANGSDTVVLGFDEAGRLLSEASAFAGRAVQYGFDGSGLRQGVSIDGVPFASYSYTGGELTGVAAGALGFGFEYDGLGRRSALVYPSGVRTEYTFDTLSFLTRIKASLGGSVLDEVLYTHDLAGNRTGKTMPGLAESYGYDVLDRLVLAERAGGESLGFGYDAVGNRLEEERDGLGLVASHDARNRLLGRQAGTMLVKGTTDEPSTVTVQGQPARLLGGNAFEARVPASPDLLVQASDASGNQRAVSYQVSLPAGAASFSYDPDGNLLSRVEDGVTTSYEWNARGQLLAVARAGVEVARFRYDPLGRRIEKVSGGTSRRYLYSGLDILEETVDDGSAAATYRYLHGPGIDEPLARLDTATAAARASPPR